MLVESIPDTHRVRVVDLNEYAKYSSDVIRFDINVLFVLNHMLLCPYNKSALPIMYGLTSHIPFY